MTETADGHFGPYGGRFVPEALTTALDELTELTGQSPDEAKALIMKAREHWFTTSTAAQE